METILDMAISNKADLQFVQNLSPAKSEEI